MSVAVLAQKLNKTWPAIAKAGADATVAREKLQNVIADNNIDSADISIVAFGSLARGEWTSGSDLDWTMLVDGEADHEHANTAHKLSGLLDAAHSTVKSYVALLAPMEFSDETTDWVLNRRRGLWRFS
jgi:UTP:GlnB (protein PII) uridylyltransferase